MTATTELALEVARRWQRVPDDVPDEKALAEGFITPAMLELIIVIISQIFAECLDNNRVKAWGRIRSFLSEKNELRLLGDKVMLLRRIDQWWTRLAFPREQGDVKVLRAAILAEASELSEEAFSAIHAEQLFLAI